MKHQILTILLIGFCSLSFAQKKPTDLSKIKTEKDAEKFISDNPNLEAKLFRIEFGTDASEIFSQVSNKQPGFSFQIENYIYKLIDVDSVIALRVSYIYLDGSKMNKDDINRLRENIISKFKSGISFAQLAGQYNMDGNTTGDTNWFGENMMAPQFEAAVKAHKKGEVFTVDIPEANWYHVVLKTHDSTYKKNFTLLKVKNNH